MPHLPFTPGAATAAGVSLVSLDSDENFPFLEVVSLDAIGTTQHKVADIYSAHAQLLVFAQQQLHGTVK